MPDQTISVSPPQHRRFSWRVVPWLVAFAASAAVIVVTQWTLERTREETERAGARELSGTADVAIDALLQVATPLRGTAAEDNLDAQVLTVMPSFANIERLSNKHLAIQDANGRLRTQSADTALATLLAPHLPSAANTPNNGTIRFRDPAGNWYCALVRRVPESPLSVLVIADQDNLFAAYRQARRDAHLLALARIALLFLAAWVFVRQMAKQEGYAKTILEREQAMAIQHSHLVEAQRVANCGSWEIGLEPGSMTASPEYLAIFQVTPETVPLTNEEFIRRFLVEPEDIAAAHANRELSQRGLPTHGIRHVRLDDGTRKWVEFKNFPRVDASGRRTGAYGICRDITEERRAVLNLAARTRELERAKDIAGIGTWTWDVDSDALVACPYTKRIMGAKEGDADDGPITMLEWAKRFIPAEDFDEFSARLARQFDQRKIDRERRLISADGRERWTRTLAEPEFDADGKLRRYHGVTLDITSQKQALSALAEKTKQLTDAQRIGRMGSWYWNTVTDLIEFSDQHRQIYELDTHDEATTLTAWVDRYCHPEEKLLAWQALHDARDGKVVESHRRVLTAKGNARWIHSIGHPVRNSAGQVIGVYGVTRDITGEKQRELALIEATRQLREAQRIAQMGHFYWDLATDTVEGFGDYALIFGLSGENRFHTMAEWLENHCHPDDRQSARDNGAARIRHGLPYVVQRRSRTASGEYRWLEFAGEPVENELGEVIAYRGIARNITAWKSAEVKLAESEAKYRLISESMHDLVALHAVDGTLLYCSPSTHALLGYSVERSIGQSPYAHVHVDDVAPIRAAVRTFVQDDSATSTTIEYRFRHRRGHYLWMQTVIVPVRDADGRTLHFQTSSRDVTERRNAADKLTASEERFRTLTEISSDWYWESDTEHRLSFLSLERTRHSQKTRQQLLGHTRWELFPQALTPEQWEEHRRTLAVRAPFQGMVTRVMGEDGRNIIGYSSLSGRPIFDRAGQFRGYRGIGRDVTRIKQAERELAESEERYRLIAQNMQDIVSLHGHGGRIHYLSPSFAAITGHSGLASIGVSPRHLLHPDDLRESARRFAEVRSGLGGSTTLTCRFRHRNGHYLWLECHLSLVVNATGEFAHMQIVARDITRRREAELQLERRTAQLGRVNRQLEVEARERQELERNILITIEMELAQVGLELHDELGQDLTGIALLTKTLERRLVEKHPDIAPEAARISELVNRTIRHTRMISHGLSPYIWGVDGLIAALAQLASDIESLGVVTCKTRLDRGVVIADEVVARSLYRIAQEATNNALKHSRAQTITLSLAQQRDAVVLKIDDDGVGSVKSADLDGGSSRFHSIRHRSSAIGAALTIRHGRAGGTSVRVQWRPPAVAGPGQSSTESFEQEAH